jgi:predicted metal-dependent peptidase
MSTASKKLAKGRAGLILDQPFFGGLALRLNLVEDFDNPANPTATVDGKEIRYNPEWIDSMSLDEVKGVLCHEIMHCANQHHTRRGDREPERWNSACDYAINPLIEGCGLTLPNPLSDPHFNNMAAEEIYPKLPEGDDKNQGNDPGKCGGVQDAPGKDGGQASADDRAKAASEWKVAVAQAATQAQTMGELPGALERMVDEMLEPVLDWREILRRFVDTSAKNDYQWFPPNRRHIHNGLILPSLRSQELKNVTMAMDTSGSITEENLKAFGAEVRAIVEDYRANTKVIYCDAKVQRVEEFDAYTPVELSPRGGGGTDFRPVFDLIEESGEYPVCLIYQTDGYCSDFPKVEPSYPILWILTERNDSFRPPFGDVIHM